MRLGVRILSLFIVFSLLSPLGHVYGVPYLEEWGIFEFNQSTEEIQLVYSSSDKIDNIRVNPAGDTFAFATYYGGDEYEFSEICTLSVDGTSLTRLTDNDNMDLYPAWSPDGEEIAFLSWRDSTLDIWIMNTDSDNQRLLYDSGSHDADIHWVGDLIAFTRDNQI